MRVITASDARYVISEIRNIPYYEERIGKIRNELEEIQIQIESVTQPVSPNGGKDVIVNGKSIRVKIPSNHSLDSASVLNDLITKQMPLELSLKDFNKRMMIAMDFKRKVLKAPEKGFVTDFISNRMSYRELADKHAVSNPYDKMVRIVRRTVNKV